MAEGSEKRELPVYAFLTTRSSLFEAHSAGAADVVFEQLEVDAIAHRQCIKERALLHVTPVEEDLASVRQPDEPVALADEQRDDSTRAGRPAADLGSSGAVLANRRRLSDSALRVTTHLVTSGVPTVDDASGRR
jgi:hypothetical protein